MTHFYTAKAVDADNIVFANHTGDLNEMPFRDPEGEKPPAGRFQVPVDTPKEQVESYLAREIKDHVLQQRDRTVLLRLSDNGEVVYWDVPKTFQC
jgi:hypothetical protein